MNESQINERYCVKTPTVFFGEDTNLNFGACDRFWFHLFLYSSRIVYA